MRAVLIVAHGLTHRDAQMDERVDFIPTPN
jgi:hypothetical protein